jgi:DNA-binding NarL/FixJ family response regulator
MPAQSSRLTEQQKKIARMLYEGKTKDDIASEMFLSWDTVNNHIRNIFKKLDVHSEADFVRYVNNNKII